MKSCCVVDRCIRNPYDWKREAAAPVQFLWTRTIPGEVVNWLRYYRSTKTCTVAAAVDIEVEL